MRRLLLAVLLSMTTFACVMPGAPSQADQWCPSTPATVRSLASVQFAELEALGNVAGITFNGNEIWIDEDYQVDPWLVDIICAHEYGHVIVWGQGQPAGFPAASSSDLPLGEQWADCASRYWAGPGYPCEPHQLLFTASHLGA